MNGFLHNIIADMPGPEFLLLYGSVIAALLLATWAARHYLDASNALPPLAVPARPDPYEIAHLRGGANEVFRVAVVSLLQRGHLRVIQEKGKEKITGAENGLATDGLSEVERKVFHLFSQPMTAHEMFSSNLPSELAPFSSAYDERLAREQLLPAGDWKLRLFLPGALLVTGLGGYKLLVAIEKGHSNVWFLIIMGAIGICWLFKLGFRRLSRRGEEYLKGLELAFGQLKSRMLVAAPAPAAGGSGLISMHLDYSPENASLRSDPSLTLIAAIFGLGILAETQYDHYQKMFHQGSSGSGGCGGGCGGDGGCGGGCGGCGGCG